jgi:hypothetical protein
MYMHVCAYSIPCYHGHPHVVYTVTVAGAAYLHAHPGSGLLLSVPVWVRTLHLFLEEGRIRTVSLLPGNQSNHSVVEHHRRCYA